MRAAFAPLARNFVGDSLGGSFLEIISLRNRRNVVHFHRDHSETFAENGSRILSMILPGKALPQTKNLHAKSTVLTAFPSGFKNPTETDLTAFPSDRRN